MKTVIKIFLYPVPVFAVFIPLALWSDIFIRYPWMDIPFHLAGGASVAASAAVMLGYLIKNRHLLKLPAAFFVLFIVGVVAIIAIGWEFFEYSLQMLFPSDMAMTLSDTLGDLAVGLLGGAVATFFASKRRS